jgi:hypothetical protein
MTTSLKNKTIDFINFKEFIAEQLLQRELLIEIPKGINLFETYDYNTISYPVTINNSRLITCNFRTIYSNLPEQLALFCFIATKKVKLKSLITSLSRLKNIYSTAAQSNRTLERIFYEFFVIVFFGDLFNSVWKGNYSFNRIFTFKIAETLFYISLYERFLLAKVLINQIKIQKEKAIETKEAIIFKLSFELNYNLLCEELKDLMINQQRN